MAYDLNNPEDYKRAMRGLMWADHGVLRLAFKNFRSIDGKMWRGNQPSPNRLREMKEMGFKTILNLRGFQTGRHYYELEHHTCREIGLDIVDLPWGSREAPFVERIEQLIEVFNSIEYPAFMHCKSGADRAGIVAVFYRLLHEGVPFEEAVDQLSIKYGHMKQGKTGMLDHFFDLYRQRNAEEPIAFMDWVRNEYDRQACHDSFMASWWGSLITEKILRRE